MRSILLFKSGPELPVLVFLHGIGEAYFNSKNGKTGLQGLVEHGIPRMLYDGSVLASGVLAKFNLVVPQLSDRDGDWNANVNQIRRSIGAIREDTAPVYIAGFSKGGRAAFEIAKTLTCRAILTIDAAPMEAPVDTLGRAISQCDVPFWAIHTDYPAPHKFSPIPELHAKITATDHPAGNLTQQPSANGHFKSLLRLDTVPEDRRHIELLDTVTKATAPFEWLLQHR